MICEIDTSFLRNNVESVFVTCFAESEEPISGEHPDHTYTFLDSTLFFSLKFLFVAMFHMQCEATKEKQIRVKCSP